MKPHLDQGPPPVKVAGRKGIPGLHARTRGFATALSPLIAMVFGSGFVFGAILRPPFLQGWQAGVLLLLIAGGLYITWKRAVLIYLRHEEGARGEEQVARVLDALPDPWQVYHGIPTADKVLDHVLVGPNQVFSIETVHWRGQVRVVNHKLLHDDDFYPGYDLASLAEKAGTLAAELGLDAKAVTPMVCVVGGRYGDYPGIKEGVWLGEIQDLGPFLLGDRPGELAPGSQSGVLQKLENKLNSATKINGDEKP